MNPNVVMATAMSVIAVLQILLGVASLKVGPNHMLGLRLPWTLNNKSLWRISQQIMFVTATTTSIGILIVCWTVKNHPVLIFLLTIALLLANLIAVCFFTYSLSKKEQYRTE